MAGRRYILPGLTLRLVDAGGDPSRFALAPLSSFETFGDGAFDHEITFRPVSDGGVPMLGTLIWSGSLIDGTQAEISRDGAILQFRVPGRLSMLDDPAGAATLVDYVDSVAKPLSGMAVMVLIDMALRGHGLLTVHAATLLARGRDGVILLFAPSGSGKTTTSLMLTLGGYGHLGDDVAVIRRDGTAFRAWGLPRDLKVHRKTAAMLPGLAPHLGAFDGEDEARLTPQSLAAIAQVPRTAEYPIVAAILIGARSQDKARLVSMSKSAALSEIIADNVGVLDDGLPAHAKALFKELAQLVAATPVYRLDAGADPGLIVPAFDAVFGPT